ncbi:MAG: hypothetical protein GX804_01235 [Lentisphaerae bacterium]|nr:hypothetical protein [Lentisphaerota bacterium]
MRKKIFVLFNVMVAACLCLSAISGASASGTVNILKNGGFEPMPKPSGAMIRGIIAEGWVDDSAWADVSVEYAVDSQHVRSGTTSQRIAVEAVRSGAVQFAQKVDFRKDRAYVASVWIRGSSSATVSIALRQYSAPWKEYASVKHILTDDWQQVKVRTVAVRDEPVYLMLIASEACTVWLDDASVEDVTDKINDLPPQKGNLLPNGSFENGLTGGWGLRLRTSGGLPYTHLHELSADPRGVTDDSTSAEGNSSFGVAIFPMTSALISSPNVFCPGNRSHAFSVALRASRDNFGVELEIEGMNARKTVRVGTEWKRYEISGSQPFEGKTRIWIRANGSRDTTTLWIDAAQLEEAEEASPEYIAAFPVELSLWIPRPGSIVFDGEAAELDIATAGTLPAGSKLKLSCTDLYGKTVNLPDVTLPASKVVISQPLENARGIFRLSGTVSDSKDNKLSATVDKIFARLPPPRELPAENRFSVPTSRLLRKALLLQRLSGSVG